MIRLMETRLICHQGEQRISSCFYCLFSQLENGLSFTLRQLLYNIQMLVWCRPNDKAISVLEGADAEVVDKEMDAVVLSAR